MDSVIRLCVAVTELPDFIMNLISLDVDYFYSIGKFSVSLTGLSVFVNGQTFS